MKNMQPKISFVVTSRNDDHGGGFMRRMQIFVNGLLAQCDRHKLKAELIVVEWNPPADRPPLYEALTWPEKSDYCTVRFIEVPPEIHNRFKYAHKLPMYQMIAKNVGIRRSRADFVLATCIDLIFSDELVDFLASGELRDNHLYRIDRSDVPEDVPLEASIDEQLDYCRENIIRINSREGTHHLMTGRYYASYGHIDLALTNLHFNACGDFTLLSKKDWFRLRGYPEFDMYSPHLDTLFLLQSYFASIKQEILRDPMRLYHIEHGGAWIGEKTSELEKEKKAQDIPVLTGSQIEQWASDMNRDKMPLIFNGDDWGFASERLKETVTLSGSWEGAVEAADTMNGTEGRLVQDVEAARRSALVIAQGGRQGENKNLYDTIKILARDNDTVFVAREWIREGKYIVDMKKEGAVVFYDLEGLREEVSREPKVITKLASPVSMPMLLSHRKFEVIMIESACADRYIPTISALSPESRVVVSAFDDVTRLDNADQVLLDLSRKDEAYEDPHDLPSQRMIEIPLNPPLAKGDSHIFPSLAKGDEGRFKKGNEVKFKNPVNKVLSVVIPSYNGKDRLIKCLQSFFNQKKVDFGDIEVIVVDHGSEDGTIDALKKVKAPCRFKYFSHHCNGRSAALNRGILETSGRYILLTSQDVTADEKLISEHLNTHKENNEWEIAVLGKVMFDEVVGIPPFKVFLIKGSNIDYASRVVISHFDIEYTRPFEFGYLFKPNLSLKRESLCKIGLFDERLQYGMEDIEFAYRLLFNGCMAIPNDKAKAVYNLETPLNEFLDRQFLIGQEVIKLAQRHPAVWKIGSLKKECLENLFGKEKLVEDSRRIVQYLENMPDDTRERYKFGGSSLLDRCYLILSSYTMAQGIDDGVRKLEGEDWLDRFMEEKGVAPAEISNENRDYELLLEAYLSAGDGDIQAFSKAVEEASRLVPYHPAPYYAAAAFYMNHNEYGLAEEALEEGLAKRKWLDHDPILPLEDEPMYYIQLAMSGIAQGNYAKAAGVLNEWIAERGPMSVGHGIIIYKCLGLCYRKLGEERRALFCEQESERLREGLES